MRDLLKPVLVTAVIVLTTAGITGAGALRTATAGHQSQNSASGGRRRDGGAGRCLRSARR